MMVYVDDILFIYPDPSKYIKQLIDMFKINKESVKSTDLYLGNNIMKRMNSNNYWEHFVIG